MTDEVIIPRRTVVIIDGLQTTQGKRINGSSACILGKPNNGRYPCAIYASGRGVPLDKPEKKSIKRENITIKEDQRCVILQRTGFKYSKSCEYDRPTGMFWMEAIHERFPEDYESAIILALCYVGDYCHDYQRAHDILVKIIDLIPHSSKYYNNTCSYLVKCCLLANLDLEEAIKWAMEIDEWDYKWRLSLESILYSRNERNEFGLLALELPVDIYYKIAKILYSRHRDSLEYVRCFGNAEYMMGNYYKAAMYYRRVWDFYDDMEPDDNGQLDDDELDELKRDLCIAQLRCPGAPLADHRIIWMNSDCEYVYAVHKSEPEFPMTIDAVAALMNSKPDAKCVKVSISLMDPDDLDVFDGAKIPTVHDWYDFINEEEEESEDIVVA